MEEIIRPLEDQGILVARTREQLEKDMQDCFLMTRDGSTIACGMLKKYSDTHAEVIPLVFVGYIYPLARTLCSCVFFVLSISYPYPIPTSYANLIYSILSNILYGTPLELIYLCRSVV